MQEEKPIIFFSHSSLDKEVLNQLRLTLTHKLAKTVEVFQSSDGQSIPFGRNWVHRIENALSKAKVMFVFISPASIKSQWLYFEAGYNYSRNIRVIPVGILGVSLYDINPPLALLQGFNITNEDGLNNIISILNDEFKCDHKTDFTNKEYETIFSKRNYPLNLYSNAVDCVGFSFPFSFDQKDNAGNEIKTQIIFKDAMDKLALQLNDQGIKHSYVLDSITIAGISIKITNSFVAQHLRFEFDYGLWGKNVQLLHSIFDAIFETKPKTLNISVCFCEDVQVLSEEYKVSAKLSARGISYSDSRSFFEFKEMLFKTSRALSDNGYRVHLAITAPIDNVSRIPLEEVIDILFNENILFFEDKHKRVP